MTLTLLILFALGYIAVATEGITKLNKAASALLMGVGMWLIIAVTQWQSHEVIEQALMHHMASISGIVFFLLGAMTIVEIMDSHNAFYIITRNITTHKLSYLVCIIGMLTFVLSAIIDNLTATIVMLSIASKLLHTKQDKWTFAGLIIICSNAGGACSPIGDVTTTMLWVGKQVTAAYIIQQLILPSVLCAIIPILILAVRYKGKYVQQSVHAVVAPLLITTKSQIIFYVGTALFVAIPLMKWATGLPPFMIMLLALACMWLVVSILHLSSDDDEQAAHSVVTALQKIDTPSILFFLGILLAVAALDTTGVLLLAANYMNATLGTPLHITGALGLLSALVDNVPLVAAAQGMYSLSDYPTNHSFWILLAYTTGTGGSIIIIGSAAGVAAMGISNIPFGWYLRYISWIALLSYLIGLAAAAIL